MNIAMKGHKSVFFFFVFFLIFVLFFGIIVQTDTTKPESKTFPRKYLRCSQGLSSSLPWSERDNGNKGWEHTP